MISKIILALIYIYALYFQNIFFDMPYFLIGLGFLLSIVVLFKLYRNRVVLQSIMTKEIWYAVAFLAISALSGFAVAPSRGMLIDSVMLVIQGTVLMIILSYEIRRKESIDWIAYVIIFVAVLQAISLVLQPVAYLGVEGRYSIAEDVNPNGLAISLSYGAFFALYKLKNAKLFFRYLWLSSLGLFVFCIIQTGSRKGFFAVIILVVLWIILCFKESQKGMTFMQKYSDFILVTAIMITGVIFTINNMSESTLLLRLEALFAEGNATRENLYIWAWETFKANPFFGVGLGNYSYYFGYYSHATYSEIIACTGLFGTILYVGIWVPLGLSLTRLLKRLRQNKYFSTWGYDIKMLSVLFAIMIFYGFTIIHFYQVDSYFILGIMLGWREIIRDRKIKSLYMR
jgi:O-antigen ligase